MPKSRKRKTSKAQTPRRPAVPKVASAPRNFSASAHPPHSPPSKPPGLLRSLMENDAELLMQIVTFTPLVFGCWLVGGVAMPEPVNFSLLLVTAVIGYYLQLALTGKMPAFSGRREILLLHGVGILLIAAFFAATRGVHAVLLLVCWWVLTVTAPKLDSTKPRGVLLIIAALVARLSVLAMLGAYSQFPDLLVPVSVIGFVPGMILGAALVARQSPVFESAGWVRSALHVKKSGEQALRPGSLTRLFTLLIILGPAVPILLVPLKLLPETLLICAVPLYFMPAIASGFFERFRSDTDVAVTTVKLAALAAVVTFIGGLLATV